MNRAHCYEMLDEADTACSKIQQVLTDQLESQSSYKDAIQQDFVVLNNLRTIIFTVKDDIEKDIVNGSTELILRMAANDFRDKIERIPEEKILKITIIKNLANVHRQILVSKS